MADSEERTPLLSGQNPSVAPPPYSASGDNAGIYYFLSNLAWMPIYVVILLYCLCAITVTVLSSSVFLNHGKVLNIYTYILMLFW